MTAGTMTALSSKDGLTVKLTDEERQLLLRVFGTRPEEPCADCGGYHLRACHRVKRQAWIGQGAGAGNRVEVEYWPDGQYDDNYTIYPEDVFSDDPEDE
jgi:hypothetical protein